ncbi:MAG: protein translocase subunit SecF [Oligoflexia bacterium]|nr:protein translocase subunit SecF [Oligoflexia bacterium]
MWIVNNRKIFYWISGLIILVSLASISLWGLKGGIDFKGGSLLEVYYNTNNVSDNFSLPSSKEIKEKLETLNLGEVSVRTSGESDYIIRTISLSEEQKNLVLAKIVISDEGKSFNPIEKRFTSVGPLLGKEALYKSLWSIILVLLCIVIFIAYAFRNVSKPISSWKYGLLAVVALAHDVIIPTGFFSIMGHFKGFEVDTLFVTALLVVLGFSVHDTIVVFDRVRENLKLSWPKKNFETIIGESVNQTFVRSINTSLTTLLAVVVLYFIGPEATKTFSLVLIIGIFFGTYSSIFLASNMLVTFEKWIAKRR